MNLSKLKFVHLLVSILLIQFALSEEEIELKFVSFPKSMNAKPVELRIEDGKTIQVDLPTNSISSAYKVKLQANWALGEMIKDEEGNPSFKAYGQAPALSSTKQLILVIRSGKEDAEGLTLIPMDYTDNKFGGGKYFVMNATSIEIAGSIGTSKFTLKPLQHDLLAPKPTKIQDGRGYCFSKFFYRSKDNIQPFFSATWRFNEAARSMVFFYHDPKTKHLRLHTIRSFVN